jgi:hypothetical protein
LAKDSVLDKKDVSLFTPYQRSGNSRVIAEHWKGLPTWTSFGPKKDKTAHIDPGVPSGFQTRLQRIL